MKRFKNILSIYNEAIGADDTLTRAAELARVNEARLMLLDVLPEGNWTSTELAERRKRMNRTCDALAMAGLENVTSKVAVGNDLVETLRQVSKSGHDIVFASAHRGGTSRGIFGNGLAIELMRKCPVPVWIVKPGPIRSCSHILAAVAPSINAEEADPVDIKIMELAASLTAACRGSLTVMNAWQVTGPDRETLSSEVPDVTREDLLRKREVLCRTVVEELIEGYRDTVPDIDVHLMLGAPEAAITETAEYLGVDVIVMGTKCRSGLSGFLFGNAAEAILQSVNCGVLVVKPDAFEAQLRVGEDLAA